MAPWPAGTRDDTLSVGTHLERPARRHRFFWAPVVHDSGLSLIYGAALSAWVFVCVLSITKWWELPDAAKEVSAAGALRSLAAAGAVLLATIVGFWWIDRLNGKEVRKLPCYVSRPEVTESSRTPFLPFGASRPEVTEGSRGDPPGG